MRNRITTDLDVRLALQLLTDARELVATGRARFVCLAISAASYELGHGYMGDMASRLRQKVANAIDRKGSLEQWVSENDPKFSHLSAYEIPQDYMRELRLVWLDKWISEIKAHYNLL